MHACCPQATSLCLWSRISSCLDLSQTWNNAVGGNLRAPGRTWPSRDLSMIPVLLHLNPENTYFPLKKCNLGFWLKDAFLALYGKCPGGIETGKLYQKLLLFCLYLVYLAATSKVNFSSFSGFYAARSFTSVFRPQSLAQAVFRLLYLRTKWIWRRICAWNFS